MLSARVFIIGTYIAIIMYYAILPMELLFTNWFATSKMAPIGRNDRRTILVTGGGGYVGSHTVLELLKHNYTVVCVDNLVNCYANITDGIPESLKRVQQLTGESLTFYNVDVRHRDDLDRVFKKHKIDAVIHFAALKAVSESVQQPLKYYQNNIAGSGTLFDVMHTNDVKSLVFSSSATVYGVPQSLPIAENHPTGHSCTNPYGKTKYFVEEILKDVCTSNRDWKVILLRYFNPVGAHESGDIGEDPTGAPNNLMPYISQVAVGRREKLQVFGDDYETPDGTGIRDYIHIMDLAEGHLKALQKLMHFNGAPFTGWKAYNLGTGRGYSVLEVVKAFSQVTGQGIKYEIRARRAGDVASSFADVKLAKEELNWVARRNLNDMCRDAWNWQVQNPNGFQQQ